MAIWIKRGRAKVDLFLQKPRGRVLDIPAGRGGRESAHLLRLGFQVIAVDLFLKRHESGQLPGVRADANQFFPFRDGCFDYVLSREGIEHLEDQASYIRDCARVLKPGGEIVLTTPNVLNLRSRLTYFLAGQRTLRRGLVNEIQTLRGNQDGHYYHGHAFLIDYFRLRYLLRLAGFDNIRVFTDRYSPASVALIWLAPVLFVASKLAIRMSRRKSKDKYHNLPSNPVFREILGHIFSRALLFGKRMIVVARKTYGKADQARVDE